MDSAQRWSVIWVSLDEGDNDPTRFWSYFIASLQQLNPDLGTTALLLFHSPSRSRQNRA
ncbi:MAG: hypothetical protein H6633_34465 [Anaerolineales bacterium]|nr:hypothetical protein [Anaerolineales bacterium]